MGSNPSRALACSLALAALAVFAGRAEVPAPRATLARASASAVPPLGSLSSSAAQLSASLAIAPVPADPLAADVRAIWVVRDALADTLSAARIPTLARRLGANTLFVQVSGRGDAYYDSDILPRAEILNGSTGDPFRALCTAALAEGISVHAWVNVGLVWSAPYAPSCADHLIHEHPEWIMCFPDGRPMTAVPRDSLHAWFVEGVFAETAHPAYRAHVASVVAEIIARYPVDGVHLDYIRRPVIDTGYDPRTLGRFLTESGYGEWDVIPEVALEAPPVPTRRARTLAEASAALATRALAGVGDMTEPEVSYATAGDRRFQAYRWPDYSDDAGGVGAVDAGASSAAGAKVAWNRFRREAVTDAVRAVRAAVDRARAATGRPVLLTAAVIPEPERARMRFAQDWPLWLEEGLVDLVVPMCYRSGRGRAEDQLDAVLAAAAPEQVIAGLGAYQQPIAEALATVRVFRERPVRGVCVFDWASLEPSSPGAITRIRPVLARPAAWEGS